MSAPLQAENRRPVGRPPGLIRRRRELVNAYIAALGGRERVNAVKLLDVERAAGLMVLAHEMRARALKGESVAITDLTRLESTADRAVRRLAIPAEGDRAAPPSNIEDLVA